ncbi:hypothetical protein BYT27DRAFT_6845514 [Phlegmacium glaucopus]|nr:hypothetical protein BYT27DRAFT_6845514 [Phlegmacium glaucopus]
MHRPLLTDLPLDLHIHICEFLHPSQILALRQTCKAVYEATLQRSVWIHALDRICRWNLLFLPTFPVAAMSVAQLERAATAPLRWIALSSSKDRNNDEVLHPRRTRVIENPLASMRKTLQLHDLWWTPSSFVDLYLVPGGRYLATGAPRCLGVWDLGSVSDGDMSDDWKPTMWATEIDDLVGFRVHPTPDGLGIRILTYSHSPTLTGVTVLCIFEIYPQKETPELAKIVKLMLDLPVQEYATYSLNGNTVVIYNRAVGTAIVWDFIANTAASWSISNPSFNDEVIKITETTIITTHPHSTTPSLRIFQIPPLTPNSSESSLLDIDDPPELTPAFIFNVTSFVLQRPDNWYYDVPIYIDILESHETGNYERCSLDIACDLSNASLVPIAETSNTRYVVDGLLGYYRICDEGLVYVSDSWTTIDAYTCSTSSDTTVGSGPSSDSHHSHLPTVHLNMTRLAAVFSPYSFCPASARFAYDNQGNIVISDFV